MHQGWPLTAAFRGQDLGEVTDLVSRFDAAPVGPWAESPNMAVVAPLRSSKGNEPFGLLVAGVSSRLIFDEQYKSFYELAANHIATAMVKARAYEEEVLVQRFFGRQRVLMNAPEGIKHVLVDNAANYRRSR